MSMFQCPKCMKLATGRFPLHHCSNKPPITTSEAGKLGGDARMKKLSKKRRHEIAMKAGLANKARLARMKLLKNKTLG